MTRYALQLAPLVFVRPGELRKAEWNEIDLEAGEWRISAERMKMKHIVPLSSQAVAMSADNNYCENQIRPFAVGRRAWMFCDTPVGASASAKLFSLVMTCRANGIAPYAYLSYLFEEFLKATTAAHLEALLPWNATAAMAAVTTGEDSILAA